ncbi:MAG: serine/threonine protein kinase [Gemmataceae bacterium]
MPLVLGPNAEPIPGYRLIERLGRGGFGEVWKAEAPGGLHKAIKFVYGDLSAAGEGEPAEQERKSLERIKSIRHPYILSLERIEEVDGQLLIVMELADRNLWDRFRECRDQGLPGIPREELLSYMSETAEALDLLNLKHQLQHLDVKPQNLFLVYNHIKVADFGLVKELRGEVSRMTGGVTPVYAAPETFNGFVSQQSDQYSLAIVYQELLTGRRPFNGTTAYQLLNQHVSKLPDLAALPGHDRPHVARSLAKKPEERFECCTDLIKSLRAAGEEIDRPTQAPQQRDDSQSVLSAGSSEMQAITQGSRPVTVKMRRPPSDAPLTQVNRTPRTTPIESEFVPYSLPSVPDLLDAQEGCLVPAVVIGLGGVGAKVLRLMRSAIQSQLTSAPLPHLRFLAIDTDSAALRQLASDPQQPFRSDEIYHASLHRPSHYLKSDSAVAVEKWLGTHALYKLPRDPAHAGVRSFGRLAFFDHAPVLARQIKAQIEISRQGDSLQASHQATKLGIRSDTPRIYIVAGLGGGTGSGMIVDFAYLARHVLRELGISTPEVVGMLLLPTAERGGQVQPAALNATAALIELNHFSSQQMQYECRVNSKFAIPADAHRPYHRCCLVPLADTNDETASQKSIGQAAAILFRDLLSPVGRCADSERDTYRTYDRPTGLDAQTAATYRLAWPAQRLHRRASRALGLELIREWTTRESSHLKEPVSQWLEEQWDLRGLTPDRLAEKFHQAATATLGTSPADRVESIISPLIEASGQSGQMDSVQARGAIEEIVKFLGPTDGFTLDGPSAMLPALFEKVTPDVIRHCDQQLAELAAHFMEQPRYRIGGAEEAIRQMGDRARAALGSYEALATSLQTEAGALFRCLVVALSGTGKTTKTASNMPRGSKGDPSTHDIFTLVRDYAKKHYQAVLAKELMAVYRGMIGSVPEFLHDANHCRQRLVELEKLLTSRADTEPEADPAMGPGKYLLAGTAGSLAEAARQAVENLSEEDRQQFDLAVQEKVKKHFCSLVSFCLDSGPRADILADAIEATADEFLATRLGRHASVEIFLKEYQGEGGIAALREAFEEAYPPLAGPNCRTEALTTIIAAPNSEAAKEFRDQVGEVFDGEPLVVTESADDILMYRELRRLDLTYLPHFAAPVREAYEQALSKPEKTPHSRIDIKWSPVK